jgi:all-trans-8'-apo-beta-carotenal 15,15'-oxygenase
MISAISFNHGCVHYRNRFVKTQGYLQEQKAGKPLYCGVFGKKAGEFSAMLLICV